MTTYIVFLRAINVSGHRIIKMEDLLKMFTAMPGIKNVRTYIQSGNVLIDTTDSEDKLLKKLNKHLAAALGYEVEIFIRSKAEIETIIKNNPYKKEPISKALKLYVSFLEQHPSKEEVVLIESFSNDLERFKVKGRELYALCRKDTTEKLKYSNMFIEKKLGMLATGRDWNTINKILDL